MELCKIVNYTDEWRGKLRDYIHVVFPNYSDSYIEYSLNHASDGTPSLVVINEKEEVIGCHLFYCTKAMVNGDDIDTHWGHDTYLNEEYRPIVGLDLMLAIHAQKGFGVGLTPINEKLQRKLKEVFFEGTYNYYLITKSIVLSPLQKLFNIDLQLKELDSFKSGKYIFRRVKNANDIKIPDDGYWFKGKRDIDFIRDVSFLNDRFLLNNVYQYYMFTMDNGEDTCYFVIRKTHYRGFPALTICDYRYTGDYMVKLIINAVNKIAVKSHFGIILFLCGDVVMEKALSRRIHYQTKEDFVSNLKVNSTQSYIITGGDADADFLK